MKQVTFKGVVIIPSGSRILSSNFTSQEGAGWYSQSPEGRGEGERIKHSTNKNTVFNKLSFRNEGKTDTHLNKSCESSSPLRGVL
jgi:hypothetical protein